MTRGPETAVTDSTAMRRFLMDTQGVTEADAEEVIRLLESDDPEDVEALRVGIGELLDGLADRADDE